MSTVTEIEAAILRLEGKEFAELMTWLRDHHANVWDQQIEGDLESGRFDALLADVNKECDAGLGRPL